MTGPGGDRTAPATSLWRNRDFNLLWTSQMLSDLGASVSTLAMPLLVLIRRPLQAHREEPLAGHGAALAEGVRFVLTNPFLRAVLIIAAPLNFALTGAVFAIIVMVQRHGTEPDEQIVAGPDGGQDLVEQAGLDEALRAGPGERQVGHPQPSLIQEGGQRLAPAGLRVGRRRPGRGGRVAGDEDRVGRREIMPGALRSHSRVTSRPDSLSV